MRQTGSPIRKETTRRGAELELRQILRPGPRRLWGRACLAFSGIPRVNTSVLEFGTVLQRSSASDCRMSQRLCRLDSECFTTYIPKEHRLIQFLLHLRENSCLENQTRPCLVFGPDLPLLMPLRSFWTRQRRRRCWGLWPSAPWAGTPSSTSPCQVCSPSRPEGIASLKLVHTTTTPLAQCVHTTSPTGSV